MVPHIAGALRRFHNTPPQVGMTGWHLGAGLASSLHALLAGNAGAVMQFHAPSLAGHVAAWAALTC